MVVDEGLATSFVTNFVTSGRVAVAAADRYAGWTAQDLAAAEFDCLFTECDECEGGGAV